MKLVTNRINTGEPKSFDDIVTKYMAAKNPVKTASVNETVKTAEEDEGPSSGQLAVEPLHQKGDSTNQPKGSSKGDDTEADSSGQPEAEGSEKFTNDPKVDKDATEETEVKEAALEDLPQEVQDKIKGKKKDDNDDDDDDDNKDCKKSEDDDEKKETEAKEETKVAKKDEDDKKEEEKEEDKEAKTEEKTKIAEKEDEEKKDEEKTAGKTVPGKRDGTGPFEGSAQKEKSDKGKRKERGETCPKEDKKAQATQFVKIANLTDKEKSRLRVYYKQLWDDSFVDALLADK